VASEKGQKPITPLQHHYAPPPRPCSSARLLPFYRLCNVQQSDLQTDSGSVCHPLQRRFEENRLEERRDGGESFFVNFRGPLNGRRCVLRKTLICQLHRSMRVWRRLEGFFFHDVGRQKWETYSHRQRHGDKNAVMPLDG